REARAAQAGTSRGMDDPPPGDAAKRTSKAPNSEPGLACNPLFRDVFRSSPGDNASPLTQSAARSVDDLRRLLASRAAGLALRNHAAMTPRPNLDDYYERLPSASEAADSARFPKNHVRYSKLLQPLEWLNAWHVRTGRSPLSMERAVLDAYDNAA